MQFSCKICYLSFLLTPMSSSGQSYLPLRFGSLEDASTQLKRNVGGQPSDSMEKRANEKMRAIHSSIAETLDTQEWLLEENQEIELPSTQFDFNKKLYSLNDFVIRADEAVRDDLRASAFDDNGQRRLLTEDQSQELYETGKITVPSVLLKGQAHVWKLAPRFYSGRRPIRNSFWDGVGTGFDYLLVYMWFTPDSDSGWLPSWSSLMRSYILKAFSTLLEAAGQLISAPFCPLRYSEEDVQSLLGAAEHEYVRHHLQKQGFDTRRLGGSTCIHTQGDSWDEVAPFLSEDGSAPTKAYLEEVKEAAQRIRDKTRLYQELLSRRRENEIEYDDEKVVESLRTARKEAEKARVAREKKAEQELIDYFRSLDEKLFHIEANRLEANRIQANQENIDQDEIYNRICAKERDLKRENPLQSISKAWLNLRLEKERADLEADVAGSLMQRIVIQLEDIENMKGEREERSLRLRFREQHLNNLSSLLARHRKETTVEFRILQLNSGAWKIDSSSGAIERHKKVIVSLDRWFWRLRCIWYSFTLATAALAGSSYQFFFHGPLSMRALFSRVAFFALKYPSLDGPEEWEDDPSSLTQTLASRLSAYTEVFRQEREAFERKPDVGLIDKSLQRPIFRIKAFFSVMGGSLLILSFMIFGTVICTLLTGLTLVSSPVLAVFIVLVQLCSDILFYDRATRTSGPCLKVLKAVFVYALPGVLFGVAAMIRHIVVHPALGIFHIFFATGRGTLRSIRDLFSGCVLYRVATKIPVDDTFLAKRIQGPGMASLAYVRLPLPAAKASVELILHQAQVHAHVNFHTKMLLEPFRRYGEFVDYLLSPLGSRSTFVGASPESRCNSLVSSAHRAPYQSSQQTHHIARGLWDDIGKSIRMAHPDTKIATDMAQTTLHTKDIEEITVKQHEVQSRARIKKKTASMHSSSRTPYDVMSTRTAELLADLQLRSRFRDDRMSRIVAIPSHARGSFRLAAADLKDLWDFTLRQTQQCADQIHSDLTAMSAQSPFNDTMEKSAKGILGSFWHGLGVRPNVETVAAHILCTLLGVEIEESLEEMDESLIIEPIFSEGDAHLVFWDAMKK